MYTDKYLSIDNIYFTNETGSCKTTVQLLQNVHRVDIAHDTHDCLEASEYCS